MHVLRAVSLSQGSSRRPIKAVSYNLHGCKAYLASAQCETYSTSKLLMLAPIPSLNDISIPEPMKTECDELCSRQQWWIHHWPARRITMATPARWRLRNLQITTQLGIESRSTHLTETGPFAIIILCEFFTESQHVLDPRSPRRLRNLLFHSVSISILVCPSIVKVSFIISLLRYSLKYLSTS